MIYIGRERFNGIRDAAEREQDLTGKEKALFSGKILFALCRVPGPVGPFSIRGRGGGREGEHARERTDLSLSLAPIEINSEDPVRLRTYRPVDHATALNDAKTRKRDE